MCASVYERPCQAHLCNDIRGPSLTIKIIELRQDGSQPRELRISNEDRTILHRYGRGRRPLDVTDSLFALYLARYRPVAKPRLVFRILEMLGFLALSPRT